MGEFAQFDDLHELLGYEPPPQSLRDQEKRGEFPRRIRIGRRNFWVRSEIMAWAKNKAAERDGGERQPA